MANKKISKEKNFSNLNEKIKTKKNNSNKIIFTVVITFLFIPFCMVSLLFTPVAVGIFGFYYLSSSDKPIEENSNNSEIFDNFTSSKISINSDPVGAEVYGIQFLEEGQPTKDYLGVTPLDLENSEVYDQFTFKAKGYYEYQYYFEENPKGEDFSITLYLITGSYRNYRGGFSVEVPGGFSFSYDDLNDRFLFYSKEDEYDPVISISKTKSDNYDGQVIEVTKDGVNYFVSVDSELYDYILNGQILFEKSFWEENITNFEFKLSDISMKDGKRIDHFFSNNLSLIGFDLKDYELIKMPDGIYSQIKSTRVSPGVFYFSMDNFIFKLDLNTNSLNYVNYIDTEDTFVSIDQILFLDGRDAYLLVGEGYMKIVKYDFINESFESITDVVYDGRGWMEIDSSYIEISPSGKYKVLQNSFFRKEIIIIDENYNVIKELSACPNIGQLGGVDNCDYYEYSYAHFLSDEEIIFIKVKSVEITSNDSESGNYYSEKHDLVKYNFINNIETIIYKDGFFSNLNISPDKTRAVFTMKEDDDINVYTINLKNSNIKKIADYGYYPAWIDNDTVAYFEVGKCLEKYYPTWEPKNPDRCYEGLPLYEESYAVPELTLKKVKTE